MILSSSEPVAFVPEVNSKKFYSFTCYADCWGYKKTIDGSSVGKHIKRNNNFSVKSKLLKRR